MKLSNSLLYLGLIIAGAVIGVLLSNFSYFTFQKEISYFDLFSLVITTTLGIYITVRLGRVLSRESSEKQLLIDEVKNSIKKLDSISGKIESRNYSVTDLAADFKTLNEDLHLLEKLISTSHCSAIKITTLRPTLTSLRRVATGQRSVANMVTLQSAQYAIIRRLNTQLKEKYFEMIFSINKV